MAEKSCGFFFWEKFDIPKKTNEGVRAVFL